MADAILAQSGIYTITNKINGKVYVGSSVCFSDRWSEHRRQLTRGSHHSSKLQRSWNKHGADAFRFDVIEIVADKAALIEREQCYIDEMCAVKTGYNVAPKAGSCLGYRHCDESKARMSAVHKAKSTAPDYINSFQGKEHTAETKAKMSAAAHFRGPGHLVALHERNRGSVASAETRAKMSVASKANGISGATRAKMIASRLSNGKKHTAETRKKISMAQIGKIISDETIAKRKASLAGHAVSEETRAKISAGNKGKIHSQKFRDDVAARMTGRKQSPETIAKRQATIAANRAARQASQ